jgi:hypothetical protein
MPRTSRLARMDLKMNSKVLIALAYINYGESLEGIHQASVYLIYAA